MAEKNHVKMWKRIQSTIRLINATGIDGEIVAENSSTARVLRGLVGVGIVEELGEGRFKKLADLPDGLMTNATWTEYAKYRAFKNESAPKRRSSKPAAAKRRSSKKAPPQSNGHEEPPTPTKEQAVVDHAMKIGRVQAKLAVVEALVSDIRKELFS